MTSGNGKSTTALMGDVVSHATRLLRHEAELARVEIGNKIGRLGLAAGLIIAGIVLALTAINMLSGAALAALIAAGYDEISAGLIVAGVLAVVASLLLVIGLKRVKLSGLSPNRAARSLRQDAAFLKEKFNA